MDTVAGVRSGHVLMAHTSVVDSVAWLRLSLAVVAAVVIAMKTLWAPVSVAVASVRMVSSSVAIAGLGEGEGGQRENLPLIND